jgi:hypothetical protein
LFVARVGAFVVRLGPGEFAWYPFPDLSFHFVTEVPDRVSVAASAASNQSVNPLPVFAGVIVPPDSREYARVDTFEIAYPLTSTLVAAA